MEQNNFNYFNETCDYSDYSDDDSSLFSQSSTMTPPSSAPRVGDLLGFPVSPSRNIDMKAAKIKFDNRRSLLERFQSISRRRKINLFTAPEAVEDLVEIGTVSKPSNKPLHGNSIRKRIISVESSHYNEK